MQSEVLSVPARRRSFLAGRRQFAVLAAALFVAGCGGGGGDAGSSTGGGVNPAPQPGIAVFAGSTTESGSADGDRATARFFQPVGLAFDASGNLWVADRNQTIRRITPAGQVSTAAGSPGLTGSDDGTGSAARFTGPAGLAIDAAGNAIVADSFNLKLRKVTPAGVVTTILTVPFGSNDARSAGVILPGGVATDAAGNLYFTSGIGTRRVSPSGTLTVLEGVDVTNGRIGTAFFQPRGVTVDRNGTMYVADLQGDISRSTPAATTLTTVAGTPLVFGAANGTGPAASFNRPASLAADASGNIYVADTLNNLIRKMTPAGVVTTVVGPGASEPALTAAIHAPMGIVVGPDGNLYVTTDNAVAKVTLPAP